MWGPNYIITWTKGHPETMKPDRREWTHQDWGNHVSDGLAELGRRSGTKDMRDSFRHGRRWCVYIGDVRCFDKLEPVVRQTLGRRHLESYAATHDMAPLPRDCYVVRTLLPSKKHNDRAWNARYVWGQAATSKRINRTQTARIDTKCRFCDKADADDLNHILLCEADHPRRRVRKYLCGLQKGLKIRHGGLGKSVATWVKATIKRRKKQPDEAADRELTRFLRGLWPDEISQQVAQLPEHNEGDDDMWPAQVLTWAGGYMHRELWRPLWKLRKEAERKADDDEETTSTEASDGE